MNNDKLKIANELAKKIDMTRANLEASKDVVAAYTKPSGYLGTLPVAKGAMEAIRVLVQHDLGEQLAALTEEFEAL
jgi:hypothetical protein